MDAVEIMRTYSRMCDVESTKGCIYCGLSYSANGTGEPCKKFIGNSPEKAIGVIEKWSAEHPVKTRQSEFLKMFPRAPLNPMNDMTIGIDPCDVDAKYKPHKGCDETLCSDCQREYWNAGTSWDWEYAKLAEVEE